MYNYQKYSNVPKYHSVPNIKREQIFTWQQILIDNNTKWFNKLIRIKVYGFMDLTCFLGFVQNHKTNSSKNISIVILPPIRKNKFQLKFIAKNKNKKTKWKKTNKSNTFCQMLNQINTPLCFVLEAAKSELSESCQEVRCFQRQDLYRRKLCSHSWQIQFHQ